MRIETQRLPLFRTGVYQVWNRNLHLFKKFWLKQILWMTWEPVLLPLIFAYGIGFFVTNIKGFSYIDFFLASLLGISSVTIAFSETAVSTFSRLNVHRTYSTMILAPMMPDQILWGEVLWATTKGGLVAFGVLIISSLLGMFTLGFFPALLVAFLGAFIFACLGVIVATYLRSYDQMKYAITAFILPITMLCDTYFPLDQLPKTFKYTAQVSPLTHIVSLIRDSILGQFDGPKTAYHLIFLLVVAGFSFKWAKKRFSSKIIQ